MIDFLRNLLRADFMPHGYCFAWRPEILWLSVFSDALIFLSYVSIPISLIYFVRRRKDLSFNWIFYMFGAFIVFCGLTHAVGILVLWNPVYRLEVMVKLATGLISVATAINLYRIIPLALAYPSPHDLEEANIKLATMNSDLEKIVDARTREVSQARDEAIAANLAKSRFLATMSHEIRTPLNGIIGTLSLISTDQFHGQQRDLFDTVRLSSDALLSIINDVLDFSKIEANKIVLEVLPFSIRQTVEEAMELNAAHAARKGLELHTIFPTDLPEAVVGDAARVRQILLNLISNAIKFTNRGQVDCVVKVIERRAESARFRFEVIDSGIGIPDDVVPLLFHPFTQADSSTTRKFGGTGLGLAISKNLTDLMGGEIGVLSQHGRGSTFWLEIDFPLTDAPVVSSHHGMNLLNKRILAVDDNRVNLKIIRSYLEFAGADVVEVTSGVRALETLLDAQQSGKPFSMAIIDVEMPIMDGIMLVRAIRSQESMRDLPIALLSSSAHNIQLPIITELHIRSVMNKPVHRDALLEAVEQTLSGRLRGGAEAFGSMIRLKGGLKILLAEDNAVNQKVATLMLQRQGAAVYIVNNGIEAFKAFQNQPFDAILMDCQMPDMDGYEATRAIRSWEQQTGRPPIPIIALTANVLSDAKSNCMAAGMDGYLNKPLTMTELVDTLNRFTNPN